MYNLAQPAARTPGGFTAEVVGRYDENNLQDHTTFTIKVTGPNVNQVVSRRYNQFEEMDTHLRARHGCSLPEMPPKSFFRAKFLPSFMDDREQALGRFINVAVSLDPFLRDERLRNFVSVALVNTGAQAMPMVTPVMAQPMGALPQAAAVPMYGVTGYSNTTSVATPLRNLAAPGQPVTPMSTLPVATATPMVAASVPNAAARTAPAAAASTPSFGMGDFASLDESGYQAVAATRSRKAMSALCIRVLHEQGWQVSDNTVLEQLLPRHSGEQGVQSYQVLVSELRVISSGTRRVVEVSIGRTADLSEHGYMGVAAKVSDIEMELFIRRTVSHLGLQVINEGGLLGVVPFFSGAHAVQSYTALCMELGSTIQRTDPWLAVVGEAGRARTTSIAATRRAAEASWDGRNAPLSEDGFAAVAKHKSIREMVAYVRRVVESFGLHIIDESGLERFVPPYCSDGGEQSFALLSADLFSASMRDGEWVKSGSADHMVTAPVTTPAPVASVSGMSAPLNEEGYMGVAALRSAFQMKLFIRRIVSQIGGRVVSESGMDDVVPFYSGEKATQNYANLFAEVASTAQRPGAWIMLDA